MGKKPKIVTGVIAGIGLIVALLVYLHHTTVAVLEPRGPIAQKERNLLFVVLAMSLIVVVPVFVAAILIALRYREKSRSKVRYSPNWDHSRRLEALWWLIPSLLIGVLSIITWRSTYALIPSRPISSHNPTLTVQVVALDWKWLFIYPSQHIATLNYADIPENTPVDFEVTADAPMNSFWVPQLGGQIYAMAGMQTHLNLMASQLGSFRGDSANISGDGFAHMVFSINSLSPAAYAAWLHQLHGSGTDLSVAAYRTLSQPATVSTSQSWGNVAPALFENIVAQYMTPVGYPLTAGMGM